MELNEDGFFEELLALRRENLETTPTQMNKLFSTDNCDFDYFDHNPSTIYPNSSCQKYFSPPLENNNFNNCTFNGIYNGPFLDDFSASQLTDSSLYTFDTPPFLIQQDYYPFSTLEEEEEEEEELSIVGDEIHNLETHVSCKKESIPSPENQIFNSNDNMSMERKNKAKKLQGQPSKNLMAERRRRKRLNDRLSMLRSIVPKISKMDRTSIVGDTIDYMKELLERINSLQQEIHETSNSSEMNVMGLLKDKKQDEIVVRNSSKFDVERRNMETQIEICCSGKPGLLLSTVTTLEALGLEIQQCVISCFNDFVMRASCSEDMEQRRTISSEDIKQALYRNAGYGGKCL